METNVRQQKTLDSSLSVMNLGKKCEFLWLLGVIYESFFPLTICNREDITFFILQLRGSMMKIWGNPVVSWRVFHNFLLLFTNKKLVCKVMGAVRTKIGHAQ